MYTVWTQHIKEEKDKERFAEQVFSAKRVLERLSAILKDDEKALDRVELSVKQFDIPNWAERQAFYNGARSVYAEIYKIIDLDQQKEPKNDRQSIR